MALVHQSVEPFLGRSEEHTSFESLVSHVSGMWPDLSIVEILDMLDIPGAPNWSVYGQDGIFEYEATLKVNIRDILEQLPQGSTVMELCGTGQVFREELPYLKNIKGAYAVSLADGRLYEQKLNDGKINLSLIEANLLILEEWDKLPKVDFIIERLLGGWMIMPAKNRDFLLHLLVQTANHLNEGGIFVGQMPQEYFRTSRGRFKPLTILKEYFNANGFELEIYKNNTFFLKKYTKFTPTVDDIRAYFSYKIRQTKEA